MPWLMLLPFMLWQMVNYRGRCYCLYFIQMADVIAIFYVATSLHVTAFEGGRCYCLVADGIATFFTVFEDGRCYCQVADGIATTGWVMDNW